MKENKTLKTNIKRKRLAALMLSIGMVFSSLFAVVFSNASQKPVETIAAEYSGGGSGFSRTENGSVKATFTVTDNNLDMKGWLLCLFTSKPQVDSNNKLINSNDIHPYYEDACAQYFLSENLQKTGTITCTWSYDQFSQKGGWNKSGGSAVPGYRLIDYFDNGSDWHIVIGPRHYNTSWGDSGYGQGTEGYWENCDYYIGSISEVFPEEKEISYSFNGNQAVYDGKPHSVNFVVQDPASGYSLAFGTTSGVYNLTEPPKFTDVGTYPVYFRITADGYLTLEDYIYVTITKANPAYTAPTAKTNLVYDGTEQALITAGSSTTSTIKYSLDGTNYSTDIPKKTNAGTYTVYYKVEESTNYKGAGPFNFNVTIAKADPIYTEPVAKANLVYDGTEQDLITAGTSSTSTIKYSLDGTNYFTDIPKKTNAGTYTVYYKIEETTNYKGIGPFSFTVTIAKADPIYIAPVAKTGLVYNKELQDLVTAGSSNILYSLDGDNYSSDVPSVINAGDYTLYYKIAETDNYKSLDPQILEISIEKATPEFSTTPVAILGLNYTAESRQLIEPGVATAGTVLYSLDGEEYSEDVPERKLCGDYTVYYKIQGDDNYKDVDPQTIEVSIYPNDKTALNAMIEDAQNYHSSIASHYEAIAEELDASIDAAILVSEDDNKTIDEIAEAKEALYADYNLAHAKVTDVLIEEIGDVRYTDKCHSSILEAENMYTSLSESQQALVENYEDLEAARDLYNRLDAVVKKINAIGEVTHDATSYNRILAAQEALETLNEEERLLIPTYLNTLYSAEDVYEMLEIIDDLGEVEYTEAYKARLEEARNIFDALDPNEQEAVYNYQDLLDAEQEYKDVDNVVNLVSNIASELEYIGTHEPDIDKAKEAYEALSAEEKALVPQEVVNALFDKEKEYEELKVEHERKEVEDREAGVAIAIEGASGIPETVSIDINNSQSSQEHFEDNIDYQTISSSIAEDEVVSSICEIKFYEEVEGELVERSLADIDENIAITVKIDIPEDVDVENFKIVLLDENNEMIEMEYVYDPSTRQASVTSNKIGTFAIISIVPVPKAATEGLPIAIIASVIAVAIILGVGFLSIFKPKVLKEN